MHPTIAFDHRLELARPVTEYRFNRRRMRKCFDSNLRLLSGLGLHRHRVTHIRVIVHDEHGAGFAIITRFCLLAKDEVINQKKVALSLGVLFVFSLLPDEPLLTNLGVAADRAVGVLGKMA